MLVRLLIAATAFACAATLHCYADDAIDVCGNYQPRKLLVIPGELNGKSVLCAIDTGATHHAFDRSLKPLLGYCRPYEGSIDTEICSAQNLQVKGVGDSVAAESAVFDLTALQAASGQTFDVILGLPFLCDRIIEIDPANQQFRLSTEPNKRHGEQIDLTVDDLGRPCVEITVAGRKVIALVDTGSNTEITLETALFDSLESVAQNQHIPPDQIDVETISGTKRRRTLEGIDISIGSHAVSGCTILEAESNKVGLGMLSKFKATIDLNAMFLEISRHPLDP